MHEDTLNAELPDTSFVPQLDARQRAMLAEMGVRVWAPKPKTVAPHVAVEVPAVSVAPAQAPVTSGVAPVAAGPTAVAPKPAPVTEVQVLSPQVPTLKPLPAGVAEMDWAALSTTVSGCEACGLCQRRKNSVLGEGDVQADWLVVGDPPTEAEETLGQPFVGPEGELLDNMLRAVGQSREKGAYVTSVVKCRPPASRNPSGDELAQCSAYLARQVALVQPKVIVAMGRFALEALTQSKDHLGRLRGREHVFEGVPVIATYHPNALLRTSADKAKAWADLCLAMDVVDRQRP